MRREKGIFMRCVMDLADTTGDGTYRAFAVQQANSIWTGPRCPKPPGGALVRWGSGRISPCP
ncbi:hypothetical protein [Streptomyces sp. NBC_00344]|uniref:hypothetical protein n=1 Tax=Streptomyces sp. NBC_00344 TaxID=2975720 RepID=UPI002E1CE26F